jgi:hypothetical protein
VSPRPPSTVHLQRSRHPFFRSYGAILPSSLTRVLSSTLGFSPRLPVSACGTLTLYTHRNKFSWQCGVSQFVRSVDWTPRNSLPCTLRHRATSLFRDIQHPVDLTYCVELRLITHKRWYLNINRLSIAYAFRPQLRRD